MIQSCSAHSFLLKMMACKLGSYINKLKKNAPPPIPNPYSLDDLQVDNDIDVLNKLRGDHRPVFKNEEDSHYEDMSFNAIAKRS